MGGYNAWVLCHHWKLSFRRFSYDMMCLTNDLEPLVNCGLIKLVADQWRRVCCIPLKASANGGFSNPSTERHIQCFQ